jgi:hypothetical protein
MPLLIPSRLLLAGIAGVALQSVDPFVGRWKFDPSRSTITDAMSIVAAGPNTYTLKFVGGEPETIVADGADHAAFGGTTFAITIERPDRWTVIRKKDGRTLLTAIWTLGTDGKTLTDAFSYHQADGSVSTMNLAYQRTAGRSGIPGTWESVSANTDAAFELDIQPYLANGLSIRNLGDQSTSDLTFDGTDHGRAGSTSVSSARRVDDLTFTRAIKLNGKVTVTERVTVSADGKTLTMTVHPVDQTRPNVLVFSRE